MASTVHFKFKSAKDFETVSFSGLVISLLDLKRAIVEQKSLHKGMDFDLSIVNDQSKEEYLDDNDIVPKNTCVVVKRIPAKTKAGGLLAKIKALTPAVTSTTTSANAATPAPEQAPEPSPSPDFGPAEPMSMQDEDQAIADLNRQAGSQRTQGSRIGHKTWTAASGSNAARIANYMMGAGPGGPGHTGAHTTGHPSTAQSGGPQRHPPTLYQQGGVPPSSSYVCKRCNIPGHFVKDCPTNGDPAFDSAKRKRTLGIPVTMLEAAGDQKGGGLVDATGRRVVIKSNKHAFTKLLDQRGGGASAQLTEQLSAAAPAHLKCSLCQRIVRDAVLVVCCKGSVCDSCIRDALSNNNMTCPLCSTPNMSPETLIPNLGLRAAAEDYIARMTRDTKAKAGQLRDAEDISRQEAETEQQEQAAAAAATLIAIPAAVIGSSSQQTATGASRRRRTGGVDAILNLAPRQASNVGHDEEEDFGENDEFGGDIYSTQPMSPVATPSVQEGEEGDASAVDGEAEVQSQAATTTSDVGSTRPSTVSPMLAELPEGVSSVEQEKVDESAVETALTTMTGAPDAAGAMSVLNAIAASGWKGWELEKGSAVGTAGQPIASEGEATAPSAIAPGASGQQPFQPPPDGAFPMGMIPPWVLAAAAAQAAAGGAARPPPWMAMGRGMPWMMPPPGGQMPPGMPPNMPNLSAIPPNLLPGLASMLGLPGRGPMPPWLGMMGAGGGAQTGGWVPPVPPSGAHAGGGVEKMDGPRGGDNTFFARGRPSNDWQQDGGGRRSTSRSPDRQQYQQPPQQSRPMPQQAKDQQGFGSLAIPGYMQKINPIDGSVSVIPGYMMPSPSPAPMGDRGGGMGFGRGPPGGRGGPFGGRGRGDGGRGSIYGPGGGEGRGSIYGPGGEGRGGWKRGRDGPGPEVDYTAMAAMGEAEMGGQRDDMQFQHQQQQAPQDVRPKKSKGSKKKKGRPKGDNGEEHASRDRDESMNMNTMQQQGGMEPPPPPRGQKRERSGGHEQKDGRSRDGDNMQGNSRSSYYEPPPPPPFMHEMHEDVDYGGRPQRRPRRDERDMDGGGGFADLADFDADIRDRNEGSERGSRRSRREETYDNQYADLAVHSVGSRNRRMDDDQMSVEDSFFPPPPPPRKPRENGYRGEKGDKYARSYDEEFQEDQDQRGYGISREKGNKSNRYAPQEDDSMNMHDARARNRNDGDGFQRWEAPPDNYDADVMHASAMTFGGDIGGRKLSRKHQSQDMHGEEERDYGREQRRGGDRNGIERERERHELAMGASANAQRQPPPPPPIPPPPVYTSRKKKGEKTGNGKPRVVSLKSIKSTTQDWDKPPAVEGPAPPQQSDFYTKKKKKAAMYEEEQPGFSEGIGGGKEDKKRRKKEKDAKNK